MKQNSSENDSLTGVLSVTNEEEPGLTLPASLIEAAVDGYSIVVPSPLAKGSKVQLRLADGTLLDGYVQLCSEVDGNEYHATVRYQAPSREEDRRAEPRFAIFHPAELSVIGSDSPKGMKVTVVNLSRSGLGARTPDPLPVGVAVEMKIGKYTIFAIVRYSKPRGGAYHAGLLITDMLNSMDEGEPVSLRHQIRELARLLKQESLEVLPKMRCWFGAAGAAKAAATPRGCPFRSSNTGEDESFSCELCRAAERWKIEEQPVLICEEILGGRGLYLRPVDLSRTHVPSLMQIRVTDATNEELRALLQDTLRTAEQAWIALPDRSVRVR